MDRRQLLRWIALLLGGWLLALTASFAAAQSRRPKRYASLQEQLELGLKARRPLEFAYIAQVVDLVEDGELPVELVRKTFVWARKKRPYPYQSFVRGLRILAEREGISIPFDG